jgi:hypothetical protein
MRTIDTAEHGPLPVLDTWRECRNTKTGWTGINEKGERLDIRLRKPDSLGPARMPDKDYAIIVRDANPQDTRVSGDHVPIGVALIERAVRSKAKKKPLTLVKG